MDNRLVSVRLVAVITEIKSRFSMPVRHVKNNDAAKILEAHGMAFDLHGRDVASVGSLNLAFYRANGLSLSTTRMPCIVKLVPSINVAR